MEFGACSGVSNIGQVSSFSHVRSSCQRSTCCNQLSKVSFRFPTSVSRRGFPCKAILNGPTATTEKVRVIFVFSFHLNLLKLLEYSFCVVSYLFMGYGSTWRFRWRRWLELIRAHLSFLVWRLCRHWMVVIGVKLRSCLLLWANTA